MIWFIVVYFAVALVLTGLCCWWAGADDDTDDLAPLIMASFMWGAIAILFLAAVPFWGIYTLGKKYGKPTWQRVKTLTGGDHG